MISCGAVCTSWATKYLNLSEVKIRVSKFRRRKRNAYHTQIDSSRDRTGVWKSQKKKSLSIMKAACNRWFSSRVHLDRTKSIGVDEIHAIELRRYCSL